MQPLTSAQFDLLGGALSFFFTVALLSYLIGDNPLYRVALHLFIGAAAGYAVLVVVYQALIPRLVTPLLSGSVPAIVLASVPLLLFLFLVMKLSPRTASLGNIAIAYMIGVGIAVAVGGAVTGTIIPLVRSAPITLKTLVPGVIILIGTVTTLLYFQFWLRGRSAVGDVQRIAPIQFAAQIGQGFLVVTLGVIYGGMILSGIAIFGDRLVALSSWAQSLIR
jgi:hypothetical protein